MEKIISRKYYSYDSWSGYINMKLNKHQEQGVLFRENA